MDIIAALMVLPKMYIKVQVVEVKNTALLETVFNSNRELYVYFGKTSCSQCYRFRKHIDTFDRYLPDTIYYVDTDYWKDYDSKTLIKLCGKYSVEDVPSIIIVNGGECIDRLDIKKMFEDNGIVY